MTLVLGIYLLFLGWTTYCEAFLPGNTERSINHLEEHYFGKNTEKLYTGHSIFIEKLKRLHGKFEEGEQKLLMTIVLDAYERIFTKMENDTQDETVKVDLKEVKDQLNKLKEHYFSDKHADFKSYVSELLALKEYDPLIQRKALFELKWVYNQASKLGNQSAENRRRRRQAKGSKKQRFKMN